MGDSLRAEGALPPPSDEPSPKAATEAALRGNSAEVFGWDKEFGDIEVELEDIEVELEESAGEGE